MSGFEMTGVGEEGVCVYVCVYVYIEACVCLSTSSRSGRWLEIVWVFAVVVSVVVCGVCV